MKYILWNRVSGFWNTSEGQDDYDEKGKTKQKQTMNFISFKMIPLTCFKLFKCTFWTHSLQNVTECRGSGLKQSISRFKQIHPKRNILWNRLGQAHKWLCDNVVTRMPKCNLVKVCLTECGDVWRCHGTPGGVAFLHNHGFVNQVHLVSPEIFTSTSLLSSGFISFEIVWNASMSCIG